MSIARTALLMHQKSVDVTSHNIANASTEGYTRQRLELRAAEPLRTPMGTIGRGVSDAGISRSRDQYLDASFRQESGLLGRFGTTRDLLAGVETVLGEPGDSGLATGLDAFFDAFSDLANDPSSAAARSLVRSGGQSLVDRFRGTADRLGALDGDVLQRLQSTLSDASDIAAQIAGLNRQIVAASKGVSAPDLEDQRDLLIDKLSAMADVQVVAHADRSVGVVAGGALLVDGAQSHQLEARSLASGGYGIGVVGVPGTITVSGGQARALVELSTTTLPGIRRQLDQFASAVVREVNAIHRGGTTTAGQTGTDFFDATGLRADSIALAAPVVLSPDHIAAGASGSPGDGSVALRIAGLRTAAAGAAGGQSLSEFYTGIVSSVGVLARAAEQGAAGQDALVAHVAAQRSSISDVSIDEEMVSLIKGQQSYAAASKIVSVADEMMQSILAMV